MPDDVPLIFACDHYCVVDKPAWLLSVPGKGPDKQDCVTGRVRSMFPNATGPMMIHRLDMETSGLLIVGLTPEGQREFSRLFAQRQIEKRYAALLDGPVEGDSGTIAMPIRPDIDNRPRQMIDPVHGKHSESRWRVVERDTVPRAPAVGVVPGRFTRVDFEPVTGRSHQIRVHAAWGLHAPVVGDPIYGRRDASPRHLLHASDLAFVDPFTGQPTRFSSPAPF